MDKVMESLLARGETYSTVLAARFKEETLEHIGLSRSKWRTRSDRERILMKKSNGKHKKKANVKISFVSAYFIIFHLGGSCYLPNLG
ncbi:hypothetical protein [Domibacillus iocasae]|uniref:hypothetical protein n=1 Tax=Domibacillus iocasae TaxID=1714016 RepID=UPI001471BD14|nr:hypothetical protein [Domibacillus iocasae]